MSKSELRQTALRSRRSLPSSTIESLSIQITEVLSTLPEFATASTLAAYAAKSDEVQTTGVIQAALGAGKTVLLPKVLIDSREITFHEVTDLSLLAPGAFGVLEPRADARVVPLRKADLVLVPVVAWDENGHRVGYGRGYFDKALKNRGRALAAGLALESQRFSNVPQGPTDEPLDIIVTEKRVVRPRSRSR
ncbi:MAG: 5-formyltetrahydrofolate cyclo-ligase [archaeon]|nr:MAG: 5-formyltetrahydrofolate cyclo-ligase [archaeon]